MDRTNTNMSVEREKVFKESHEDSCSIEDVAMRNTERIEYNM